MAGRVMPGGPVLAAALACSCRPEVDPPSGTDPGTEAGAEVIEAIDPTRRCGQSGPAPTRMPLYLAACPTFALLQQTSEPQSMWLSTRGIRRHAFDEDGTGFEIELSEDGSGAWALDIGSENYLWQEAHPKLGRHRVMQWEVSIDEVVENSGLSIRATVRRATEAARPPDPIAVDGCGEASPRPTTVPKQIRKPAPVVGDFYLVENEAVVNGPLEILLSLRSVRAVRFDGDHDWVNARVGYVNKAIRIDRELLRIDETNHDEVRVRRLRTRCPQEQVIADTDGPRYVWLSTIGFAAVAFGKATMELRPRLDVLYLQGTLKDPIYRRPLEPDTVGDAFTIDDWLVEVLAVESSGDAMYMDSRWRASATFPMVHVQLRITPPDPDAAP